MTNKIKLKLAAPLSVKLKSIFKIHLEEKENSPFEEIFSGISQTEKDTHIVKINLADLIFTRKLDPIQDIYSIGFWPKGKKIEEEKEVITIKLKKTDA